MDGFSGGGSLGQASGSIELDATGALKALDAVGAGLRDLGNAPGLSSWIDQHERSLTTIGTGLLGIGAAVTGAFGIGIKTAGDFEQQMSAVGSVTGSTGDALEALRQEALRLGAETAFSASEAAEAMEIMAKAGVSTEDILAGATEHIMNLANATGVSVPEAAETAAAAMNVFGVSAEEAADVISRSANVSSLDVNDWALAMKSAAPVAASLGYDIDDLAAAMIILGDAGIKGEVAATALRNIMLNMSDPTGKAAEALAEYGVAVVDANGSSRELDAITADLATTWGDLSESQRLQLAQAVAGRDGAAAFMTIMDAQTEAVDRNSNAFDENKDRMEGVGTASEQAAQRMDNFKGSWEEMTGAIETLMIEIGSKFLPILRSAVDGVAAMVRMFLQVPAPIQTIIAGVGALTGILSLASGAFLLMLPRINETVKAFRALGGVSGILGGVGKAVRALGVAFRALTIANPIMLALTGAVALFFAYQNNWFGIRDGINAVVNAFMGLSIVQAIMGGLQSAIAAVTGFIASVVGHFNRLRESVNPVQAAFQAVAMAISELAGGSLGPIQYLADVFWNLGAIVTTVASAIKAAFEGDWGKAAATLIKGWSNVEALFTAVRKLASSLVDEFDDIASTVRRSVVRAFDDLGQRFSSFQGTFSRLGGYLSGLIGVVQGVVSAFAALFRGDFRGFAEGMIDAFTSALDAAQNAMLVIPTLVYEAFQAIDWGEVGSLLLAGLQIAFDLLMDALRKAGSAIVDVFRDIDWGGAWGSLINAAQAAIGWVIGAIAGIDWGALVQGGWSVIQRGISLAWDAITSLNWADFVPEVVWSAFVTAVDLAAKVGTFLWDTFVTAVDLTAKVGSLAWSMFVKSVDLASKVAVFTWNAYVTAVDLAEKVGIFVWSHFVTAVDLAAKVGEFAWDTFVTAVDLTTKVAALAWSSFVTALTTWSDFITSISWSSFVPDVSWSDFIPELSWPSKDEILDAIKGMIGLGDSGPPSQEEVNKATGGAGGTGYEKQSGISGTQLSFSGGGLNTQSLDDFRLALLALQRTLTTTEGAITAFVGTTIGVMGGWSTGLQTMLGTVASAFTTQTGKAATTAQASITTFVANTIGVMGGWSTGIQNIVNSAMSTMQSRTSSGTSSAKSSFTTFVADTISVMAGWSTGLGNIVNSAVSQMVSRATSGGQQMASAFRNGAQNAASAVRSALSAIPGIVASVGGSAASAAFSVGANIGQSMAAGMRSALGAISAAANQMVAEADRAVRARARIASPSKLFHGLGEYIGEGFDQGIRSMFGAIQRTAGQMVHIPDVAYGRTMPEYAYAGARGGVVVNHYHTNAYALTASEMQRLLSEIEHAPEAGAARAITYLNEAERHATPPVYMG